MTHNYRVTTKWTGNLGEGTKNYKAYNRNHEVLIENKPTLLASSDPAFMGDNARHNPEDLFLASLSSCHMLWYLHLCSIEDILVVDYIDHAKGTMIENKDGSGQFTSVTLTPTVTIIDKKNIDLAEELHHKANKMCFIANSCNFEIKHKPEIQIKSK